MKYLRKFNLNENYEDINDESNVTKVETKVGDRVTYGVDTMESFEEYDEEDEDNRPHIDPEDCECREEMEESGIEYTQEFHWDKDQGVWICEHCGTQQ